MHNDSEDDYAQQVNQTLSELMVGASQRRKDLFKGKMGRTKKSEASETINQSVEEQVVGLQDKLQRAVGQGERMDLQIAQLKQQLSQLTKESNFRREQQQAQDALNESSIAAIREGSAQKEANKRWEDQKQAVSKQRLVEMLRSTPEYRSFVYYYDSQELSYLKRLQIQHMKNRTKTMGEKQRALWAPVDLLRQIRDLNQRQGLGLSQFQQEKLVSEMKVLFQQREEAQLNTKKGAWEWKLAGAQRQRQRQLAYDVVQVRRARERAKSSW